MNKFDKPYIVLQHYQGRSFLPLSHSYLLKWKKPSFIKMMERPRWRRSSIFFFSFQQKKNTFLFTKRKLNFEALFAHWTRIQMYHLAFFVKQYALYAMYISLRQTLMFDVSISFFFSSKKKSLFSFLFGIQIRLNLYRNIC